MGCSPFMSLMDLSAAPKSNSFQPNTYYRFVKHNPAIAPRLHQTSPANTTTKMAQITRTGSPGEVSGILPRSSTNTYQYSPFSKDAEKSSIRLIRLLPGYPSSPVVVELVTVPLDPGKIPYYEAVSYVWGTSYQQYEIACDGLSMAVSESALLALRRFRFVDHIR